MKQSLQLKLGQQLTMTPQLQQAIRLLQLSTLDLQLEIQQTIESNPMLELDEAEFSDTEAPVEETTATEIDEDWVGDLDSDIAVDTGWDDVFETGNTPGPAPESDTPLEARTGSIESLADHLRWQLNLTSLSERDLYIAEALIDSISPKGWLETSIDELAESFPPEWEIETDEIQAVLSLIQHFDPTGVGARDLAECLLIQLKDLPEQTPYRSESIVLVREHMDLLGKKDYQKIQKLTQLQESDISSILQLIQTLDPYPGENINSAPAEYITPDVYVSKKNNQWFIELNNSNVPKLRINPVYAAIADDNSQNSSDHQYLRNNLQEARWFLKSLQSRNETLLKVTAAIVERQRLFLEYGEEAMKPMVLQDIAEAVEMHESTISRVTNRKYMHTPRGIVELKYFFSSHVSTTEGGECSSTAIRALIKKIVAEENPKKPLSDNKIAQLLESKGIQVARRTVAKYRESLGISSSSERKRLV